MTEAVKPKAAPVFTADQQVIENGVASLLSEAESPIKPELIFEAIKTAKNHEDLADRLAVLMDSDSSEFEDVLSKAMFAADVLDYAGIPVGVKNG